MNISNNHAGFRLPVTLRARGASWLDGGWLICVLAGSVRGQATWVGPSDGQWNTATITKSDLDHE